MPQRRLSGGLSGSGAAGQAADSSGQAAATSSSGSDGAAAGASASSQDEQQREREREHGEAYASLLRLVADSGGAEEGGGSSSSSGSEDDEGSDESAEEEDEEEEEGSGSEQGEGASGAALALSPRRLIGFLLGGRGGGAHGRGGAHAEGLRRLPAPVARLGGPLAARLNLETRAWDLGQAGAIWPCLDGSFDAGLLPPTSTELLRRRDAQQMGKKRQRGGRGACEEPAGERGRREEEEEEGGGGRTAAPGVTTRRRAAAAATAAAAPERPDRRGGGSGGGADEGSPPPTGFGLVNTAQLLLKREVSLGRSPGFSRSQQRHLHCYRNFPLVPQQVCDSMPSRAYIGQYSASGDFYVAAFQDRRVRLYDTRRGWRLRKDVTTRMTRWTITDTALSPDQRLLVYASISPVAFVVAVGHEGDLVDSQANITELHEPLAFDSSASARGGGGGAEGAPPWAGRRDFGIWSVAWAPQGGQLIAGTNDESVYLYDVEARAPVARMRGHGDDVNAVAYLQDSDPHLVVSGSDDELVRLWDTRDRRGAVRQPAGVLVGHTEGITHLCPKGDGVHLISNSKDQTIKLWDVRAALSPAAAAQAARRRPQVARWDYRWEEYPASGFVVQHPADVSLMTYRGHTVLQTLVRAYFSPAHTTAQRFIYAGSSDGTIGIWDVVSGEQVARCQYHRALVRDCSWHPHEPELTSVSWDGRVVSWGAAAAPGGQALLRGDRGDVGRYF